MFVKPAWSLSSETAPQVPFHAFSRHAWRVTHTALGFSYNHLEPSLLSVLHILEIWPYHKTGLGVFIFQFSENTRSVLIQLNCGLVL